MNQFGTQIRCTIFGQSHGTAIGIVMDGMPVGEQIDLEALDRFLALRAPGKTPWVTARREPEQIEWLSGMEQGCICSPAVCAVLRNEDIQDEAYAALKKKPRPSHADYPARIKYGNACDLRGGGAFSGRLTAPLCIAGGIALQLLERRGIAVGCHFASIGTVEDAAFSPIEDERALLGRLAENAFPVMDPAAEQAMKQLLETVAGRGDSVGGVIECKAVGLPCGLGNPMFSGLENELSRMIFGIPAVKGMEFGDGFAGSRSFGSEYNDSYFYDENGNVRTETNHSGGICGGMSTGMPLLFRVAVKPTPSIAAVQKTVDLEQRKNTEIEIRGRHDPCVALRAAAAVRAAAGFVIWDLLSGEQPGE